DEDRDPEDDEQRHHVDRALDHHGREQRRLREPLAARQGPGADELAEPERQHVVRHEADHGGPEQAAGADRPRFADERAPAHGANPEADQGRRHHRREPQVVRLPQRQPHLRQANVPHGPPHARRRHQDADRELQRPLQSPSPADTGRRTFSTSTRRSASSRASRRFSRESRDILIERKSSIAMTKASPAANATEAAPVMPRSRVSQSSNGVEKPRAAIVTVHATHSSEYSSESLRLRTRSSTKRARATAPKAVTTWVRDRKSILTSGVARATVRPAAGSTP